VVRTRVGYAGGKMPDPDYHHMGDHTETVQVDYDPERISYARLLDVFWKSHTPGRRSGSQQYKNAVFYHDASQRELANASRKALEERTGQTVRTEIVPLNTFTMAEDYHQKYLLKNRVDLNNEMKRYYPNHRDLVNSTAATRLNGYAGGHGKKEQLAREVEKLGLRPAGQAALEGLIRR